jgi:hypothetical protein
MPARWDDFDINKDIRNADISKYKDVENLGLEVEGNRFYTMRQSKDNEYACLVDCPNEWEHSMEVYRDPTFDSFSNRELPEFHFTDNEKLNGKYTSHFIQLNKLKALYNLDELSNEKYNALVAMNAETTKHPQEVKYDRFVIANVTTASNMFYQVYTCKNYENDFLTSDRFGELLEIKRHPIRNTEPLVIEFTDNEINGRFRNQKFETANVTGVRLDRRIGLPARSKDSVEKNCNNIEFDPSSV